MALKATSVRLDDETLKRVGQMAEAMDRPRAWLMAQAIKQSDKLIMEVSRHKLEVHACNRLILTDDNLRK
ncbi:CopG family ribbon-helix-helix protein [Alkalimarinus coralli]|uniref:CopG family ribbon-helix-helix protein n=1 Tax=Alkalimarinus coralli TaxID=2935863 RepID=UPI00202BA45F|nr:ribbon-helix-helix domain-containing protein [Alkalimarinus coralli]